MTLTDQVVKSKLEDEFYIRESANDLMGCGVGQTEGDEQFIFILDQFKDRFADAGVKVVFFSKCTSTNRSACWKNNITKTCYCYTKLKFPNGVLTVSVAQLKDCSGKEEAEEKIPIYVLIKMEAHNLR
eukprot:scaffold44128_cov75-Cyclotella_meneghiniana.AAC.14